jgi:hypothetical protein
LCFREFFISSIDIAKPDLISRQPDFCKTVVTNSLHTLQIFAKHSQ